MRYDPDKAPEAAAWLALDEDERMGLVLAYGEVPNSGPEAVPLHALVHAIVENQIAAGDASPVAAKLTQLIDEGLSRHEAIHAIGSVLAGHISKIMGERAANFAGKDAYFEELGALTREAWESDEYWGTDGIDSSFEFEEEMPILNALNSAETLPVEALREATEKRDTLADAFVSFLAAAAIRPALLDQSGTAVFFVFHLMAQWRHTDAYRAMAQIVRLPGEDLDLLFGEAIEQTLHRSMAAVFDGDPEPLHDIIMDPGADEYIRSRMFDTLTILTVEGKIPREDTKRFLLDCYASMRPQEGSFAWVGWQQAISALHLAEMRPLVERAFKDKLVDPGVMELHHFEEDLAYAQAHPDSPYGPVEGPYVPFGDVVDELEGWTAYEEPSGPPPHRGELTPLFESRVQAPVVNPNRNVGRNDPCPCGSGKKYKKCCLV